MFSDFLADIGSWVVGVLGDVFSFFSGLLQGVLPTSPFSGFLDSLESYPYLSFLCWFIPVADIVRITGLWLGAIALYYAVSIILRIIRAVQ